MVDVPHDSKKGMVTGVNSPHSILVNGTPRQRSASFELDDNDKASESDSDAPLFFSVEPNDSSGEPEERDPEDDNNDAKNERGQVGTTGKEIGGSYPIYVEAHDEGDRHFRVIYMIRRSEKKVEEKMT